jgi:hypothetical protein
MTAHSDNFNLSSDRLRVRHPWPERPGFYRLIDATSEAVGERVTSQRSEAPVGDIAGAVENLVDHYEEWGESSLRLLAQEERVPAFRRTTDAGRILHYEWVERTFAPLLAERDGEDRERY